ncbi:MAG: class I SAM-dependent methyltransferase [Deltaproteobacteria bacterium]|nr:class I SAM-dependent methyltransferase [Deltaproteobacteria bacterium]
MTPPKHIEIDDVEAFNDELARSHDIDDYYARSSLPVRLIEGRRLKLIQGMVAAKASDRILEVGCGGGHVLRLFRGSELTGVDVSGLMLDKAKRNLAGTGARLLKGELSEQSFADESFDAIICTEVLEHVQQPAAILEEMGRLLHPAGRAVITFPNDRLINGAKALVRRTGLTRLPMLSRMDWGGDDFHLHLWTVAEMRALLARYFEVNAEGFAPSRALPIRCCFRCRRR